MNKLKLYSCAVLSFASALYALNVSRQIENKQNLTSSSLPKKFLNNEVLQIIKKYQSGETVNSAVKNTGSKSDSNLYGTTAELRYMGRKVASAGAPEGAYCSGMTLQVFLQACENAGGSDYVLTGISPNNVERFRKDWYGVDGNKRTLVDALVSRGLGQEILDPRNAAPGDFMQFWWRDGYGHSVVFLGWNYDENGKLAGIRYWSAENGYIGEATDRVGGIGRMVDSDQIYIVRAYEP